MEISNITVLREPALDCRYNPKVRSWELGGDCARSHLNYFKKERDSFSKILNVTCIFFICCSKLYCTVGGIMKSVMENALKSMGVSLFKIRPLIRTLCRQGNIGLTLWNASYEGTVALGSSPQVNGADVLLYHKARFYKICLLHEYVMALIPERNKTYIITYALCVNSIRLLLPRWH